MRYQALEHELSNVSQPILSVYLEAGPSGAASRSSAKNPRPWIKKQARSLALRMTAVDRQEFQAQVNRVDAFLKNSVRGYGATAIFSAPSKWIYLNLPTAVKNEISWGKPALAQLRRIADELERVCIIVVDRTGARFFRTELGELSEMPAMKFEINVSQWKRKEHGHMARRNTRMPHGPLRDVFKRRLEEQYRHFYRHIAERAKFVCAKDNLHAVFLVGSERLIKPIESALPREIQERTVLIGAGLGRVAPARLQATIVPKIREWMVQRSAAQANRLLESVQGAVVGLDETLALLQAGRIGDLLIVKGVDVPLRQCGTCGSVNRSADPVCAICGGPRRKVMLSQVLYDLAKNHHTRIEALEPEGARKLAGAGGLAGWVRQPIPAAARR